MNLIDSAYLGKTKLWKLFLFGYAIPLLLSTVINGWYRESGENLPEWAVLLFGTTIFLYNVWICISLWRCSSNTASESLTAIAKFVSIFIGLNLLLGIETIFQNVSYH